MWILVNWTVSVEKHELKTLINALAYKDMLEKHGKLTAFVKHK